jgi:hypothetical protein
MTRKLGILLAVITGLVLTAGVAMAAITFHSGPTITFSGTTATATFNISGLGNEPAFATLVVTGTATYECVNKGGNAAPGQNPVAATPGSTTQELDSSDKNGRDTVTVTATVTAPATPTSQAAGCPNGKWTVNLTTLTATGATLTIEQPLGTQIYP